MSGFLGVYEGKKCYIVTDFIDNKYILIGNSNPIPLYGGYVTGEFYWHLMFESIEWQEL